MTLVTVDNSTIGEVWLNRPLDYETTKNLTILLAVNNTAPGFTDTCNGTMHIVILLEFLCFNRLHTLESNHYNSYSTGRQ